MKIISKRGIPEGLRVNIELRKKDTLDKIKDAINEIQEDGGIVTKSKLIEITNLSSSTFSSKHVKKLLELKKVCQYANRKLTIHNNEEKEIDTLKNELDYVYKEINKLKSLIQDKDIIITRKEKKIETIKEELDNYKQNYELILGKVHLILQELDTKNITINTGFDIL